MITLWSRNHGDSRDSAGFCGILRDSAGSLGDSEGFSGFLEKVYEVSEVSNPSEKSEPLGLVVNSS